MRSEWKTRNLEQICEVFADGDWIESKDQSPTGIRLVQTGNVGNGVFKDRAEKARYISEDTFRRLRCTEILEGDCLVSRLPDPVARSCLIPSLSEKCITAVDCTIIRFDRSKLIPELFNYFSQSREYAAAVAGSVGGATRQRISRKNLGLLQIPPPPIDEQRRIVEVLDKAFAGIAIAAENAQRNLANARALFDSYLATIFNGNREGWNKTTLENLGEITSSKRIYKSEYAAAGVPFYRTKEIKELANGKALTTELYISKMRHAEIKQKFGVPAIGDVLMTAIGTIGEIYIVDRSDDFYFKDGNVLWIKRYQNVDPYFLKFALRSFILELQNLSHGSAYNALPIHKLKSYAISVPPGDIQSTVVKNIVSIEGRLRDLEILIAAKLSSLSELKQSILQKAFAGELT